MPANESGRTFRSWDGDIVCSEPEWPLEIWYAEVRDIPVEDMEDGHIARACRQGIFLEAVAPVCIKRIQMNPLAGDMYDGELLMSLGHIPGDFWRSHRDLYDIAVMLAYEAAEIPCLVDLIDDLNRLINGLEKTLKERAEEP